MPTSSPTGIDPPTPAVALRSGEYSLAARLGVILWAVMVVVIAGMVIVDPSHRSVSDGYLVHSGEFWRGEPVYDPDASAGYLYLPAFVLAYFPFLLLGLPVGDLLWRALGLAALVFALYRMARRLESKGNGLEILGLTLLISLFGAAAAIRNGQSTVLLLAATLLAFDAAFDRANATAAAWATIAVVAKPLGIVVWLLIGGICLPAVPWLLAFLAICLALPYAVADAAYVSGLYRDFADLLRNISPEQGRQSWTDLMAVARLLDVPVDPGLAYAVRGIAAVATLVVAFILSRRKDYLSAAVFPAILASSYMLLFNPRAEVNTYILMAVPFSLFAAYLFAETRQYRAGWLLVTTCIALGTGAFGTFVMKLLDPWSKPLLLILALVVSALALRRAAIGSDGRDQANGSPA